MPKNPLLLRPEKSTTLVRSTESLARPVSTGTPLVPCNIPATLTTTSAIHYINLSPTLAKYPVPSFLDTRLVFDPQNRPPFPSKISTDDLRRLAGQV